MKEGPLRYGFTTGTCAAAAAKAAAAQLLAGIGLERAAILTPKGIHAELPVCLVDRDSSYVTCAVQKDAGDDPDVTHGSLVYARVSYIDDIKEDWYESELYEGLYLTGGKGIGRVTKRGLSCPVGKSAINPVPRSMIFEAVDEIRKSTGNNKMLLIIVSIPEGVLLAEKTFNPNLGIEGGISVLGTSGIVEPMSEQALLDTIRLEIHMKAVEGNKRLVLVPGNYGIDFLVRRLGFAESDAVKCSNFIAASVEMAAEENFEEILLAGHIGKLIKVAGGVKNTHSKYGDRRMELLAACTESCLKTERRQDKSLLKEILESNTTEEALAYLNRENLLKAVLCEAAFRAGTCLLSWVSRPLKIEVVTFSTVYDILGIASLEK